MGFVTLSTSSIHQHSMNLYVLFPCFGYEEKFFRQVSLEEEYVRDEEYFKKPMKACANYFIVYNSPLNRGMDNSRGQIHSSSSCPCIVLRIGRTVLVIPLLLVVPVAEHQLQN
ncbi:hypothetical protein LOAG_08209 [Loa loa]|uniref:Uncharacterized protein n=1 Tax=Loa loa TaxID=7209 RepID=A0A1S0TU12_LOALO|nr:hypothetical protein LOAG_08209 [Loa loa]EFO20281.1 hypothetical protein LOAG_08209 [Loa loa]